MTCRFDFLIGFKRFETLLRDSFLVALTIKVQWKFSLVRVGCVVLVWSKLILVVCFTSMRLSGIFTAGTQRNL